MTSTTTIVDRCDIAAHRAWHRQHRSAPAYLRGLPSWVWQSAARPPGRGSTA